MEKQSDLETRIALLESREEIKELTARYCWHVVRGEGRAVSELYVPDGAFEIPSEGKRLRFEGREAIANRLAALTPAKEVPIVACHIIEIDGDEASATCAMRNTPASGTLLVGFYYDKFRRENGKWYFAERRWFTYVPNFAVG